MGDGGVVGESGGKEVPYGKKHLSYLSPRAQMLHLHVL